MSSFVSFASAFSGVAGLLFFFAFFALMLLWVFRPGAKQKAEKYARIPLNEDEYHGRR